ncbi:Protein fmp32, mitochondrial [Ciborinia camelliae]|nr:Protein fmp32, mitochondrial [Ciborinia camelliae]
MAKSILNSAQTLPRFLLPKLSWQTRSSIPPHTVRALSAAANNNGKSTRPVSGQHMFNGARSVGNGNKPRTSILQEPSCRRAFHATPRRPRDHHFDTLKFVQKLRDEGFTEPQAVAMMKVLSDVIEESIQNLTRTMVLREDAARATYTQKVDFAALRSELLSADSTESSTTRASHERLTNDLAKLNARLRDEVSRTQASVRLDLNLEKGRIREEANVQDLKIKETETKIEQEVAGLREKLEGVKFQTLQWLMGVCTGTAALILGAWRLLM